MNIISQKIVKINKDHNCWGCMRLFPKGTEMQSVVAVDCGEINRVYWCDDCQEYINNMDYEDYRNGFSFGELLNDDEYRNKIKELVE